ncbi:unnamed protein product [Natator depressus]
MTGGAGGRAVRTPIPVCSRSALSLFPPSHRGVREAPSMKLFTLLLTLAILAGSQASLLSDEPTPRLEQVCKAFWEYVAKATSSTEKTMELIRKSELGQEIKAAASATAWRLPTTMAQSCRSSCPLWPRSWWPSRARAQSSWCRRLQWKGQRSVEDLQAGPAPYAEGLLEQAEQRAETPHHSVAACTQELSEKLQQSVEKLRSQLGPFAQELSKRLQQPVQEFQQGLEPYMQKLQGSLSHGVQHVHRNLHPYAEDLQGLPLGLLPAALPVRGLRWWGEGNPELGGQAGVRHRPHPSIEPMGLGDGSTGSIHARSLQGSQVLEQEQPLL